MRSAWSPATRFAPAAPPTCARALALIGGVSVAPGGDAGPASAVPGLLGVREVDDLLLLIDGIPAGGAFVPQVEAISLNNVERIEVLRGAAPVYFGTTAFAGTINVIHYAAGHAEHAASLRYGSYDSGGVDVATVLSTGRREPIDQRRGERRQAVRSARRLQAGPGQLAAGHRAGRRQSSRPTWTCWRCARNPTARWRSTKRPGSSPRCCPWISTRTRPTPSWTPTATSWCWAMIVPLSFGRWGSTLAYTETHTDSVRGFIDLGDTPQPWSCQNQCRPRVFQAVAAPARPVHRQPSHHQLSRRRWTSPPASTCCWAAPTRTACAMASGCCSTASARRRTSNRSTPRAPSILNDRRRFLGLYAQSRYQLDAERQPAGRAALEQHA